MDPKEYKPRYLDTAVVSTCIFRFSSQTLVQAQILRYYSCNFDNYGPSLVVEIGIFD